MVSLKGILPNTHDLALAGGAAVSGTITGYIQQMLPINLEFLPGMTEFIIGIALKKLLLKKGIGASFAKGISIAGLSNMIASFVPQFAGTFPSGKGKNQYRPNGIHTSVGPYPMRSNELIRSPGFENVEAFTRKVPYLPTRFKPVPKGLDAQS